MNKPVTLACRIPSFWHIVEQIRDEVKVSLAAYPEEIREAGVMTASELVENAIKYSSNNKDAGNKNGGDIGFELSADSRDINIRVTNPGGSSEDYENLASRIRQVCSAPDIKALYISRLAHLMENPCTNTTGLGVYRIAYEGHFTLSCSNEEKRVCINAVRKIERIELVSRKFVFI